MCLLPLLSALIASSHLLPPASTAMIKANRAFALKRLMTHARGKMGRVRKRFSNLECVIKEWPTNTMGTHAGRLGKASATRAAQRATAKKQKQTWLAAIRAKALKGVASAVASPAAAKTATVL